MDLSGIKDQKMELKYVHAIDNMNRRGFHTIAFLDLLCPVSNPLDNDK